MVETTLCWAWPTLLCTQSYPFNIGKYYWCRTLYCWVFFPHFWTLSILLCERSVPMHKILLWSQAPLASRISLHFTLYIHFFFLFTTWLSVAGLKSNKRGRFKHLNPKLRVCQSPTIKVNVFISTFVNSRYWGLVSEQLGKYPKSILARTRIEFAQSSSLCSCKRPYTILGSSVVTKELWNGTALSGFVVWFSKSNQVFKVWEPSKWGIRRYHRRTILYQCLMLARRAIQNAS